MKEVKNILGILRQTRKYIREDNPHEIKILSDRTIHSAAIYQDPENIIIAVLVYAIGKILERDHYRQMPGYKTFHESLIKNLDEGIKCLEQKETKECHNFMGEIRRSINDIDGNLSDYIRDVFTKADINKAFKLYEHGLSAAQTAALLGVSLWDMASYIGQSHVHEARATISMPIQKRIQIAERFFG